LQDFYDLTWAFLQRAAEDKVAYVEIMFDPQTHTERGVPFETVVTGISKALADADTKLGIQGALMMNFLRHLGPEPALKTLQEVCIFIMPYVQESNQAINIGAALD
jgi:adenosine deaminase